MNILTQEQLDVLAIMLTECNNDDGLIGLALFLRQQANSIARQTEGFKQNQDSCLNDNEMTALFKSLERANEHGSEALVAFMNSTAKRLENAEAAGREADADADAEKNPPPYPRGRLEMSIENDTDGRGFIKCIVHK